MTEKEYDLIMSDLENSHSFINVVSKVLKIGMENCKDQELCALAFESFIDMAISYTQKQSETACTCCCANKL